MIFQSNNRTFYALYLLRAQLCKRRNIYSGWTLLTIIEQSNYDYNYNNRTYDLCISSDTKLFGVRIQLYTKNDCRYETK